MYLYTQLLPVPAPWPGVLLEARDEVRHHVGDIGFRYQHNSAAGVPVSDQPQEQAARPPAPEARAGDAIE